jgi:hypothetical protein
MDVVFTIAAPGPLVRGNDLDLLVGTLEGGVVDENVELAEVKDGVQCC